MALWKFIYSLGIPLVGEKVSKILARFIKDNYYGDFDLFIYLLSKERSCN